LFVIYALLSVVFVLGSRSSYQALAASYSRARTDGSPALIYGAGRRGASALRGLLADASQLRPVGFIDDDPGKASTFIDGVPVVGSFASLELAIERMAAHAVVVASDGIPQSRLATIAAICQRLGVSLLRLDVRLHPIDPAAARQPAAMRWTAADLPRPRAAAYR